MGDRDKMIDRYDAKELPPKALKKRMSLLPKLSDETKTWFKVTSVAAAWVFGSIGLVTGGGTAVQLITGHEVAGVVTGFGLGIVCLVSFASFLKVHDLPPFDL